MLRKYIYKPVNFMKKEDNNIVVAKEGKIFRRKVYGVLYGRVLKLGHTIDPDGTIRPETIDDYEEVDEPSNYELGSIM